MAWTDGYWWSNDGLRLHYRDHGSDHGGGHGARPPILCIPGLTRNARDFEPLAERLAGEWRLICVELRGRGESAHARDPMSYVPLTYLQDLEALIRELKLDRFIVFGTSLGGLLAMLLATADNRRLAGFLLNDVGAALEEKGLERIRSYVGRSQSWPTWLHAARHFQHSQNQVYPGWSIEQWLAFAKRLCRLNPGGRVVLDYDMRIAEPMKLPAASAGFDGWLALGALRDVPGLAVRGEYSDILSEATMARMEAELPLLDSVTVPGVGHAPTLEEPEAIAAIDRLLGRIAAGPPPDRLD